VLSYATRNTVIYGTPPFAWTPVLATALLSIVFIVAAIWRFNRQEF